MGTVSLTGIALAPTGWSAIACPVCGGGAFKKLFSKEQQDFVECDGCGLVMINPRPSFEEIAAIYASDYSGRYIAKKKASKERRARRRNKQAMKRTALISTQRASNMRAIALVSSIYMKVRSNRIIWRPAVSTSSHCMT